MYSKIFSIAVLMTCLYFGFSFSENQQKKGNSSRNIILSFGKCTLASIDDSAKSIYVKGVFNLSGICSNDVPKIMADIWEIAKSHPKLESLKLSISLKDKNEYGEVVYNELGDTDEIDLIKARRYKSAYYYTQNQENLAEVLSILVANFKCAD